MTAKASMSDTAVRKATGKTWPQWFALLDKAGAKKVDHSTIARIVNTRLPKTGWPASRTPDRSPGAGWWCQMVTVEYERARKGRKLHERPNGFEISVGKTLARSMASLHAAWMSEKQRSGWLKKNLAPKKTKQKRTLRFTWSNGSPLDIRFDQRPSGACRVMVTHSRLKSTREAAKMKAWWKAALERLEKSVSK